MSPAACGAERPLGIEAHSCAPKKACHVGLNAPSCIAGTGTVPKAADKLSKALQLLACASLATLLISRASRSQHDCSCLWMTLLYMSLSSALLNLRCQHCCVTCTSRGCLPCCTSCCAPCLWGEPAGLSSLMASTEGCSVSSHHTGCRGEHTSSSPA